MTCKERILSDEYADIITDYVLPEGLLKENQLDYCLQTIDDEFGIAYVRRQQLPPLSIGGFNYAAIPNLYGLMQTFQTESLAEVGNLRVQGPPLALQGRGVIIGFIDTGERVIILSG